MTSSTGELVHHLYRRGPALDLLPYRGIVPGPDQINGDWHTGHDRDVLLQCVEFGFAVCVPGGLGRVQAVDHGPIGERRHVGGLDA